MLENLKQDVRRANIHLANHGFDSFLRGSISALDRANSLIVISPTDIFYDELTADMMVVVDLGGNIVEGTLEPAVDIHTHIELYKAFSEIGGIVQHHTPYATAWAQAGRDIPPYGSLHAESFRSAVPCTRELSNSEIETDYEKNLGLIIVETFQKRCIDENETPCVSVFNHGPYAWGTDCFSAVYNAAMLENIAKMSFFTEHINSDVTTINKVYLERKNQKQ